MVTGALREFWLNTFLISVNDTSAYLCHEPRRACCAVEQAGARIAMILAVPGKSSTALPGRLSQ